MIIPELKPGEHIVFYEELYCYDHLNNSWELTYKVFDNKELAIEFIKSYKNLYSYTNFIGPLTLS